MTDKFRSEYSKKVENTKADTFAKFLNLGNNKINRGVAAEIISLSVTAKLHQSNSKSYLIEVNLNNEHKCSRRPTQKQCSLLARFYLTVTLKFYCYMSAHLWFYGFRIFIAS